MALPFFHLHRDGEFWKLVATPSNDSILEHTSQIRAMSVLNDLVAYAELDAELAQCFVQPSERALLRNVLVCTYFTPAAQLRLLETVNTISEAYDYSALLLDRRKVAEAQEVDLYRPAARSQGFRRAIVTAYNYRCAMCGIRVRTIEGHAIVEAAHIHAWIESRNDNLTNGLALCRVCHWSFDQGLLSADRERVILVSPQLSAQSNVPGHLAQLSERPLIGPEDFQLAPDPGALSWHRRHVFRSR